MQLSGISTCTHFIFCYLNFSKHNFFLTFFGFNLSYTPITLTFSFITVHYVELLTLLTLTVVHSSHHGFITNQQNNHLPTVQISTSAIPEHCTGIAEVMVSTHVQARFFFSFRLYSNYCFDFSFKLLFFPHQE